MLGNYKTVQKSCRFTEEEIRFVLDNFSEYGDNSFNHCLSNMIEHCYEHKTRMSDDIKCLEQRLQELKEEIASYERISLNLERIENSVNSALYCANDLDKKLKE